MSDRPKIHGFCAAGCKWETVHKDEFEKSATWIRQRFEDDGSLHFQTKKEYKIFAPKDTHGKFTCRLTWAVSVGGVRHEFVIDIPIGDIYADSFVFRPLAIASYTGGCSFTYDLAGVRYTEKQEFGDTLEISGIANDLTVTGATEVFLYNADASIKGENGDGVPEVTTADDGKFLVVENGAWVAKQITTAEEVEV